MTQNLIGLNLNKTNICEHGYVIFPKTKTWLLIWEFLHHGSSEKDWLFQGRRILRDL